MRYFLPFLLLLSLASCASERIPFTQRFEHRVDSTLQAQATQPVLQLTDVGKLKINGPVTIQTGQGHSARTTETDNTGRNAREGANGGSAVTQNSGPGFGTFAIVALLCFAAGVGVALKLR